MPAKRPLSQNGPGTIAGRCHNAREVGRPPVFAQSQDTQPLWLLFGCGSLFAVLGQFGLTDYYVTAEQTQTSANVFDFFFFAHGIPIMLAIGSRNKDAGFRHFAWLNGARAVASNRGVPFRLVLLNSLTPDLDGFAFARLINAYPEQTGIVIIMLSSIDRGGDATPCRELGIAVYLSQRESSQHVLTYVKLVPHSLRILVQRTTRSAKWL